MQHDSDALAGWCQDMARRGVLASSIDARYIHVRAIANDLDLFALTVEDVEGWLDNRRGRDGGPIVARTRYGYWSSLGSFYSWARRCGWVETDPTEHAVRPRLRPGLPRPMRVDLLRLAISAGDDRMRLWCHLAALGGLRVGEIASLDRNDVLDDLDPWFLFVVGKGRRERFVPVHPELRMSLQRYGLPRSGRLFTASTGKPYSGHRVSAMMCDHLDRLGIPDRPHAMRHWFGTTALEAAGGDIRAVQELMGHSSPNTTALYTRVRSARQADVVGRMAL